MAAAETTEREQLLYQYRAQQELLRREGEYNIRAYMERVSPTYEDPVHMSQVCDALDLSMREPVFCLIEAPPRHWKTETLLHGIARHLEYRPTHQVAYASYASALALRKSRRTRDIAAAAGLWVGREKQLGSKFDPSQSVAFWQTAEGGGLVSGGRGGAYVGEGFQKMVVDDPFKNREEAESHVVQEKVWEMFQGTLFTRLEPGGSMFVTHQPWNREDLIARIKRWAKQKGVNVRVIVITLPAVRNPVYDDNQQLIGGEPLAPQRYSLKALADICSVVGPYNWLSQYMCERVKPGKKIFPELKRYVDAYRDGGVPFISCDPGISANEKEEARKSTPDPTGIVVGWCWVDRKGRLNVNIVWAIQVWLESIDLLNYLEELQRDVYDGAPVLLEEVSAFKILDQVARRLNPDLDLVACIPKGSKAIRSQPTAAAARAGLVRAPIEGDWLAGEDGFLREIRDFDGRPGGRDNRVDALVQLFDFAEDELGATATAASAGAPSALGGNDSAWGARLPADSQATGIFADMVARGR